MNLKKKLFAFSIILCVVVAFAGNKLTKTNTESKMKQQGLVNIQTIEPSIKVSLMYSRADNFCGSVLYSDIKNAFLHPLAAKALAKAQQELKRIDNNLSLIVFDATRPMSVQQIMWNKVKGTKMQNYVSNPANGGGLHNYGMAVDLTICNQRGDTLDMGTHIDFLGKASHIDMEEQLVANKIISRQAVNNRKLLRKVMKMAGFKPLKTEWWHFNFITRAEAKKYYKVIK